MHMSELDATEKATTGRDKNAEKTATSGVVSAKSAPSMNRRASAVTREGGSKGDSFRRGDGKVKLLKDPVARKLHHKFGTH